MVFFIRRSVERTGVALHHLHRPQVRWACFTLWCLGWIAVAILLLMPLDATAPPGSDLIVHAVLFGLMAAATVTFCHRPFALGLLALLTVAGGLGLEFAQDFVPYRSADVLDGMANAIGGAFGYAIALIVLHFGIRPSAPPMERTQASRA